MRIPRYDKNIYLFVYLPVIRESLQDLYTNSDRRDIVKRKTQNPKNHDIWTDVHSVNPKYDHKN